MEKTKVRSVILLNLLLLLFSLSGVFSKMAAKQAFLSPMFLLYYCGIIGVLGVYAIGWQQVIKRLDLTTAYANKAITVVWGILLGVLFFGEQISWNQILGGAIIICGVVLFVRSDLEAER